MVFFGTSSLRYPKMKVSYKNCARLLFREPNSQLFACRKRNITRVILTTIAVFLISACQGGFLISRNFASLSIDVDVPNKVLFLTYEFEFPVRAVQFSYRPDRDRSSSWSSVDSAISLNGNILSSTDSTLFQKITVKVDIEKDATDQGTPALSAIGNMGLLLFNAYLFLDGIPVTKITANIARDQVVIHEGFVSNNGVEDILLERAVGELHHIYFGDQASIYYVGNSIIVSSIEPENNAQVAISNHMASAMQWIDELFGLSRQHRPVIVINFDEDNDPNYNTHWSGTTTTSGEIVLEFRGDSRTWKSQENEDLVLRLLVHELVHFAHFKWFEPARNISTVPLWIFEGLAGYLAITYAHGIDGFTREQTFVSEIEDLASECLSILEAGDFGISRVPAQAGTSPYDECGVLAFWVIDGQPSMAHRADQLRMVLARMNEMPGAFRLGNLIRSIESGGDYKSSELLQMLIEGPKGKTSQWRSRILEQAGIDAFTC